MSSTRLAFAALCVAVTAVPRLAAEVPADPAVAAAVRRGADALRHAHAPAEGYRGGDHGIGSAGLCGLALLEAGVKPDEPSVQNIARLIRTTWTGDNSTYNVSLAILFLDALGDPADLTAIQLLGTRLYGGLNRDGTYSYQCADLIPLNVSNANELIGGTPPAAKPPEPKKPDDGFPKATGRAPFAPAATSGKMLPAVAAYNAAVRRVVATGGRTGSGGDHSNTQFGLIGLWVAGRHGVPVDDAFTLLEAHFLTTQNPADAGWGYSTVLGGKSTTAMTCAGLLGLAIGTSRNKPVPQESPAAGQPGGDNPFDRPKVPKAGEGPKPVGVNPLVPQFSSARRKAAIDAALSAVGAVVKTAAAGQMPLNDFVGLGDEYYTLWSIERVGMAYALETLGGTDWHKWGVGVLLPKQTESGSWPASGHGGTDVATAFAVLFLTKSNFVKDLTRQLTGQVKDPGSGEMRAGKDFRPPLIAPQEANPGAGAEPGVRPGVEPPTPPAAQELADALVNGTDFATKLAELEAGKGGDYTSALVAAIPKLDDAKRSQARDALAERLTRMTAKTLREMLTDPRSELRRGAALACAMKDASDLVVQAARAGLKSLTGQDFGPQPGADEAARAHAAADWNKWYLASGGPK
jgi:hypothetical protein